MSSGVHEGMDSLMNKVEKASSWPNITFERIFFIFQLLRGGIDWCPFVQGEIVHFRYLCGDNTSGATKVSHFDDHAFSDQDIFRLEVTMEDTLDVHDDESFNDLFKDS